MASSKSQCLSQLNQRSALLGSWEVGVFNPNLHKYVYNAKQSGKPRQGADFRCILVSIDDRSQYIVGHLSMRFDNMKPLTDAESKVKPNLKFRLTKVQLDTSVKQE